MTVQLERRRIAAARITLGAFCDGLFGGAGALVLVCALVSSIGAAQLALSPPVIGTVSLVSLSISLPMCILLAHMHSRLREQLRRNGCDEDERCVGEGAAESDALLSDSGESLCEHGLRAICSRLMRYSMIVAVFLPAIPSVLGALAWLLSLSALSVVLNVLGFVAGVGTHVARQLVRVRVDHLLRATGGDAKTSSPSPTDCEQTNGTPLQPEHIV